MNKILYEASYIGNARGFANNVMVASGLIFFFIMCIYAAKKTRKKRMKIAPIRGKSILYIWHIMFGIPFLQLSSESQP